MESRPILVCLLLALAAVAAGCSSAPPDGAPFVTTTGAPVVNADPSAILSRVVADVNTTLEEIDRNVASAAGALGASGLTGPEANATLARLAASSPYTATAITVTPDGRIAAAMPEEFGGAVGTDIGNQSHVQRGMAERRPQMSDVFRTVEGFDAVVVQRPVTKDGTFLGLVSTAVEPDLLLADRADRAASGTTLAVWAMTPDGRMIYDRDPGRIGRNAITDPAYAGYPEFVAMAKRIAAEPAGSGSYTLTPAGGAAVKQEAVWATAGLHGTAWRIVVVRAG
ncbi:MAG: cache domain-containing protein [Methanospirillum sp.]